MIVIGIAGEKYNGKDTAANPLIRRGFIPRSFATGFKGQCYDMLVNLKVDSKDAYEHIWGDRKQEPIPQLGGKTGREMMQEIGAAGRRIYPDIWVDMEINGIYEGSSGDNYVITDVRHHNENDKIRANGGYTFRIVRPGVAADEYSTHESEIHIKDLNVDQEFVNDGTIADLERKIKTYLYTIIYGA